MQIKSSAFENNQKIPAQYTCDGENVSPPLEFLGVPQGARSLALVMDDPDAPGGTWVHWMMWNILPTTIAIAQDSVPAGAIQGVTSFGKPGYGGPCPPSGEHRYLFKLYALNDAVSLAPDADVSQLESTMEGHIMEKAELAGLYARTPL